MPSSRIARWAALLALVAPLALSYQACAAHHATVAPAAAPTPAVVQTGQGLAKAEFASLVQGLSEDGGFFHSDNFTSNETSYLHVVDKLRELGVSGGAYLGVGPEQNFTYIAKVRPRLAFIVDIRRQAMLQHLMYKAVFEDAETRGEFLARLFSRQVPATLAKKQEPEIEEILDQIAGASGTPELYAANRKRVLELIEKDWGIPLSETDRQQLDYVYATFQRDGLSIAFRFDNGGFGGGYRRFPDLRDLILERDLNGGLGNFLATAEDYRYVRGLHLENRIVPLVGDFAGKKALRAVGDYLRKQGLAVSAFYTSNVEQFLFQNGVFGGFAENVRALPIDEKSVFIRAVPGRYPHPALFPGHRTATTLEKISVFLQDVDAGAYTDYRDLVTTHFIAGSKP